MKRNAFVMRPRPGCGTKYKNGITKDIMDTNPDESPASDTLKEIFQVG
ncbi:MAG: L-rhamnose mutarotase [Treponema sp.]|jgi:L-rhamnose mutarotase|nr:L-rhamnose mutarotase [Treponema sp.]